MVDLRCVLRSPKSHLALRACGKCWLSMWIQELII